jgi:hypothetical protein
MNVLTFWIPDSKVLPTDQNVGVRFAVLRPVG